MKIVNKYAALALRDMVMFPHMIVPLFIGREKSLKALEVACKDGRMLLIAQKNPKKEDPKAGDLYKVGVVVNILQVLRLQDSTVKVLVEGAQRVLINKYTTEENILYAEVRELPDEEFEIDNDLKALHRAVLNTFEQYSKLNKKISGEVMANISQINEIQKFCNVVSAHVQFALTDKQEILEQTSMKDKMAKILLFVGEELKVLETELSIRDRVQDQLKTRQKRSYLNEKLQAIYAELGDEAQEEVLDLSSRIQKAKLPKDAKKKAEDELKKLRTMNSMSSEAALARNYIEWLTDLPWYKASVENKDLGQSLNILDKHHYGLTKVKERIIEYLAVAMRTNSLKGPIICLVGPPGAGKTSLAKSIAESVGREFVSISLGGLRDEAEIKGHRKTYIGAMPGKIIQAMKKAKKVNPVILLDEIDKMSSDFRGDPASAMLDVLDPEQNKKFSDHYIEVDYDLSKVMFIATANTLNIPSPLLDRMEVIRLSGYTEAEKLHIAKGHLVPKQHVAHGIKQGELSMDEDILSEIISRYTREAGVRNLDREIAKITRKAVKKLMTDSVLSVAVNKENLAEYLGPARFAYTELEKEDLVGTSNGLAYTEFGGDVLFIETVCVQGKGETKITGKLGEVMKESVQAAISYIRSKALEFSIDPEVFSKRDIHIHVPEGATPKDGPSAGVAICAAIVSVLTGIPVRRDVAMTGEITLRGRVLEIGGLKEKLLAALQSGIHTVLIPQSNAKDLEEIKGDIGDKLKIIPVETISEALSHALTRDFVFNL